ncbi:hypothetical protein ACS0TY_028718 [Phlomoides rotata]
MGMQLGLWADTERDYSCLLRGKGYPPPSSMSELNKKGRGKDEEDDQNCCREEVDDPRYVHFFEKLRQNGESYIVEYEEDGVPVKIKYEGDLSVDEECDVEPVRKLKSATRIINKPSDQMFGVEDQRKCEMGKKQGNMFKSKKEDNAKSSNKLVPDPDYDVFIRCSKVSQNKIVCEFEGNIIVYDEGGKDSVRKKDNDRCFPGVEIIDPDTFYKERTPSFSSASLKDEEDDTETEYSYGSSSDTDSLEDEEETSKKNKVSASDLRETKKFRQDVIEALREPYNKEEHDMLFQEVKHRRQEERHLDLRNGRERSYSTSKMGKSYLDHYPVFSRKLLQVQHDKLKSLNLLRGFFHWIKQPYPPFRPWVDAQCCAITPGSAINGSRDETTCHDPGPSKTLRIVDLLGRQNAVP